MKNLNSITVRVSQTKVKKGVELTTNINAITIETNKKVSFEKIAKAMTNNLVRKYKAKEELKEQGVKTPFSPAKPFNIEVIVDNKKVFDFETLKTISGMEIKFPSYVYRKQGEKPAREKLLLAMVTVINDAKAFNEEVKSIFE